MFLSWPMLWLEAMLNESAFLRLDSPCLPKMGDWKDKVIQWAVTSPAQMGISLSFSLTLICLLPRSDSATL